MAGEAGRGSVAQDARERRLSSLTVARRRAGTQGGTQADPRLAQAEQAVQTGRLDEALVLLRRVVASAPSNAAVQHDLGVICLRTGQVSEAIAAFHAALAANPRFALASVRLGVALQAMDDHEAALTSYRHAAALQPSLVEARYRAGALLESLGRGAEALATFRRGAASAPKTSLGRLCLARALVAGDRDAEAESVLRQLLALDAGSAAASEMLGTVLANAGRFDEARICYERAIRVAPYLAGSFYDLVRCRRITEADGGLLDQMRAALDIPGTHPETRLKLHLALGKAADDLGDPARAMRHFDAADTLRASLCAFDMAAFSTRIDSLIERFTPELIATASACGRNDPTPLLIVGLPRSGTTLVEQILSCHPQVHACGEIGFWTERGPRAQAALAETASDYLRLVRAHGRGAARVTDKMPLNLFWAGLIHLALPAATIIHCRRRPIDTALSIHRTYFNQHVAFPTGGEALVGAILAMGRLAAHWHSVLPPGRFVTLDYDELARDPEPVIRRLIAACGLPWDDSCLYPERNPRVVKTPSKWQVRQPIFRSGAEPWRRYEPWLGPLAALKTALP